MPKYEKFPGTKPPDERSGQNKSKAISYEDEGEDTPCLAVAYSEIHFYRGQDRRENGSRRIIVEPHTPEYQEKKDTISSHLMSSQCSRII